MRSGLEALIATRDESLEGLREQARAYSCYVIAPATRGPSFGSRANCTVRSSCGAVWGNGWLGPAPPASEPSTAATTFGPNGIDGRNPVQWNSFGISHATEICSVLRVGATMGASDQIL
jgi:hypothetical protein